MFEKILNLLNGIKNSNNPFKYFVSRLFVNFPNFFRKFYFNRKNYKLHMSPSAIAAGMFVEGEKHLNFDEDLLKSLIRHNDYFIDVGANIGHIPISLKKNLPSININCFAIEANPNTFKILNDNIRLNKLNIKSINCAVGHVDNSTVKFQDSVSDDCNSVITDKMLNTDNKNLYVVEHKNEFIVEVKTLDSLVDHFSIPNNIRLIKIDTEGYEFFVLKGGKNILQKTEMIYFEYWEKLTNKYDYKYKEIFFFLRNLNFEIYQIPEHLDTKDFDIDSLKLITETPFFNENQNLLAINKRLL